MAGGPGHAVWAGGAGGRCTFHSELTHEELPELVCSEGTDGDRGGRCDCGERSWSGNGGELGPLFLDGHEKIFYVSDASAPIAPGSV